LQQVCHSTDDEEFQPVHAVSDHTTDGAEDETRGKFKEADEPEKKSRMARYDLSSHLRI